MDQPPPVHVLLVDDEPKVAHVVSRMLQWSGMVVTSHDAAASALADVASRPDAFDVAVLDVHLPGMGGPEMAGRLWDACAGLPVVFVSGDTSQLLNATLAGRYRTLSKPVPMADLIATIRELVPTTR